MVVVRCCAIFVTGLTAVALAGCGGGDRTDVAVLIAHAPKFGAAEQAVDIYGTLGAQFFGPLGCSSVLVAPNEKTLTLYEILADAPSHSYAFHGVPSRTLAIDIDTPRSLLSINNLQISSVQGPEYSRSGGFNDLANELLGHNVLPPEKTYGSGGEAVRAVVDLSSTETKASLFRKRVDASPEFPETVYGSEAGPAVYEPARYVLADAVGKQLVKALRKGRICTHRPNGAPLP